ncbi:MAG: glycoside hydrolase family protein [Dysgonamonadaceae bacterium]|jgi:hypothetical protein|nr:glycoside hydrolase family protein [Dysgonamonadaceae bacterium]
MKVKNFLARPIGLGALIFCFFLLTACERSVITPPVIPPDDTEEPEIPEVVISTKKGVGMGTGTSIGVWWKNLINLKPYWFFTWGTFLTDAQWDLLPEGIEFIPMFWNGAGVNQANIDRLNALHEAGRVNYLLGFNEPDLAVEANMTVEEALVRWKFISDNIHPGIKLISPAESYPRMGQDNWLVRFMRGVEEQGLRVDYIQARIYAPSMTVNYFTDRIRDYSELFGGKKIWLTELGVRNYPALDAGRPDLNPNTPLQTRIFLQSLLPALDAMEQLDRYAWFQPSPTMAGLWPGMLIDVNGVPTIVGEFYRDFQPNNNIVPRQ